MKLALKFIVWFSTSYYSLTGLAAAHTHAPAIPKQLDRPMPRESILQYPFYDKDYTKIVVRRNLVPFTEAYYYRPRYIYIESLIVQSDRPTMKNVIFSFK